MTRSRETLLRRHLKRHGISIHDYRTWVGAPDTERVQDFFIMNPDWTESRWKKLVVENRRRVAGCASKTDSLLDVDTRIHVQAP